MFVPGTVDLFVSQVSHVPRRINFNNPPLSEWRESSVDSAQMSSGGYCPCPVLPLHVGDRPDLAQAVGGDVDVELALVEFLALSPRFPTESQPHP